jgi:DNA polymerase I
MIDYRISNGELQVLEWYRDNNRERKVDIITDFKPYFYVGIDELVPKDARIIDVLPTTKLSIFGDKLKKVVVRYPNDIFEIKEVFSKTFEADLPLPDRYRIDKGERHSNFQNILFFDIETQDDLDPNGENEIVSIACYDNESKEYFQFVWRDDFEKKIIQKKEGKNLILCTTEIEMLESFVEYFNDVNPDIICGWNSEWFDMPYLYNRLEKTKIGASKLSSTGFAKINKKGVVNLQGRYCFDMLNGYKRIHENNLDSNRLGDVAEQELGYGKEGSALKIMDMWKNDLKSLIKYNLRDVEILVQLNDKLGLFDFYLMYSKKTNASLNDVFFNSKLLDMYLLSVANEKNIVLPSKTFKGGGERIKGAKVFDPAQGLLENIAIFDLKSLYPSIIMTFNMSPETCNGFMDFRKEPKGLIPEALEDLFEERVKLKSEGKDNEQRVVKELMNSAYGVMLFESFRMNNRAIGESITATGRNVLKHTKGICEKEGYEVISGDTDSVFVKGVKDKEEAKELMNKINKSYDDFVRPYGLEKHRFEIEFEEFVEIGIFSGKKKKYALKTDNG